MVMQSPCLGFYGAARSILGYSRTLNQRLPLRVCCFSHLTPQTTLAYPRLPLAVSYTAPAVTSSLSAAQEFHHYDELRRTYRADIGITNRDLEHLRSVRRLVEKDAPVSPITSPGTRLSPSSTSARAAVPAGGKPGSVKARDDGAIAIP